MAGIKILVILISTINLKTPVLGVIGYKYDKVRYNSTTPQRNCDNDGLNDSQWSPIVAEDRIVE